MSARAIRIALQDDMWTRAVIDGTVRVDGFDVEFPAGVTQKDRLDGVRDGLWDGNDAGITDYILEREAAIGVPKAALPVFMHGGLRQRTLLMKRETGLETLRDGLILMLRVLTPGSIYLRGFLADELGLGHDAAQWGTLQGAEGDADVPWITHRLGLPGGLQALPAAAEMVVRGEAAALIHPGAAGFYSLFGGDAMIGATLERFPELYAPLSDPTSLASWFKENQVYPIIHPLTVSLECLDRHPGLGDALIDAMRRSWQEAERRMPAEERAMLDKERELLGYDPYRHRLGDVEKRSLNRFVGYLLADGLLRTPVEAEDLFVHPWPGGGHARSWRVQ